MCNICGWHGTQFTGPAHSELAGCPSCGSIARDRFLFWCWAKRTPYNPQARVLETSPRLDARYRDWMGGLVHYTASDFDAKAHQAMVELDLQHLALGDESIDVTLTPHVLEHVPETGLALDELYRVTRTGGVMILMIPMPQGVTAPPLVPEFHGDDTVVFWRFGWDLRDKLEAAGFAVECLVPQPLIDRVRRGDFDSGLSDSSLDEVSLLSTCNPELLTAVADGREARRYGFEPDAHFIAWLCRKPAGSRPGRAATAS